MKKTLNIIAVPAMLILGALSLNLIAAQSEHTDTSGTYRMLAYDQCELVADIPLNKLQVQHYNEMQDIEVKVHLAEQPLHDIEAQITALSRELEELTTHTKLQSLSDWQPNSDTMVKINSISEQIERIMDEHQPQFDHLEVTASEIEQAANRFEHAINASLDGLTYQQIEILTPSKPNSRFKCTHSETAKSSIN